LVLYQIKDFLSGFVPSLSEEEILNLSQQVEQHVMANQKLQRVAQKYYTLCYLKDRNPETIYKVIVVNVLKVMSTATYATLWLSDQRISVDAHIPETNLNKGDQIKIQIYHIDAARSFLKVKRYKQT